MTGKGILDYILKVTEHNSDDADYRSLAFDWLKLIFKDIDNRQDGYHWKFLEVREKLIALTADTFGYALATIASDIDTTKVLTVYDKVNDRVITYVPYERFKELVADETTNSGDPQVFTIYAGQILLWPVPNFDAVTGTATATTALKLRDATATFITSGVKVGMQATDTVAGTTAIITALDSEIALSIDTDIFVLGEAYSIKSVVYMDYIKVMTAPADDTATLIIPDKYEKVVIDGMMEFAYQFDPELGSRADANSVYTQGLERMITENMTAISENKRPTSHRDRYYGDSKIGAELPLANTNY